MDAGVTNPLILYLSRRDDLTPEEIATIEELTINTQEFDAGSVMIRQGSKPHHSCLLLEGLAVRAHYLPDGKRMISAMHVPGDFIDLHSLLLGSMDHDVAAITRCKIAVAAHSDLRRITERLPHLGRLLWLSTVTDAAMHRTWIVALGRMSPISHLAHLICEMYIRLDLIGMVADRSFRLPITQTDLSDMLGLSVVHVNRTLQDLRATGLMSWAGSVVTINDWAGLVQLGQFDADYLNLIKQPR